MAPRGDRARQICSPVSRRSPHFLARSARRPVSLRSCLEPSTGRAFRTEREGFEPSRELSAPYSLSRRVPSATRPPLRRISDSMRRLMILGVGVLVVVFVASQLIVSPIAEHDLAGRLTAGGGHAQVELSAF